MTVVERCPNCGGEGRATEIGCVHMVNGMRELRWRDPGEWVPAEQLRGAVEAERLLAAALEDDHLDPLDVGRAAVKALTALRGQ